MNQTETLRLTVFASLFAALIAVGAYIAVPLGPVPIVLQSLFIYLAALCLGSRWGAAAVGVYLMAGAIGLPVFAGGTGGIHKFIGPTGGYLTGFLPAAFLIGWVAERHPARMLWHIAAMIAATLIIYTLGAGWLKVVTGLNWPKVLAAGVLPFIPGDAVKIAAAAPIARAVRPMLPPLELAGKSRPLQETASEKQGDRSDILSL